MAFNSALWTGLKEKLLPQPVHPAPLRTETIYVAVNYKRNPPYIAINGHYLARDARIDIASIFHPGVDWRVGWKMAKAEGWRIQRAKIVLEPGQ